uniref:Uncharacterized protein n=1 Tax=Mola mola TaxID=94237 RepID=A0A3Q4A8C3_MOLML
MWQEECMKFCLVCLIILSIATARIHKSNRGKEQRIRDKINYSVELFNHLYNYNKSHVGQGNNILIHTDAQYLAGI